MRTIIAALLCGLVMWSVAGARTWRVEKDGSGDYSVIQDALDAAASGDTVLIGPGRFEDFLPDTAPGGDYLIIAKVEVGDMTIIGSGSDSTVLGPTSYDEPYPDPHPIGVLYVRQDAEDLLRVESLSFENLRTSVYAENTGRISVHDCRFTGGDNAVTTYSSGLISGCHFIGLHHAIISFSPADSVIIDSSIFDNSTGQDVAFESIDHGIVRNCEFTAGSDRRGGVFYNYSGGGVYRSRFVGLERSITLWYPQLQEILDNEIRSYYFCIDSTSEAFIAERNYMSSEMGPVFSLHPDGLPHRIRHNHIIKGENYAVEIHGCNGPDGTTLDMTENWWGTTDPDSIAAWIYDGHDQQWPHLECYVDFEPFLDGPVPADETSLGGLKARYR